MKTFIIFLALVIVNVNMLVFQTDCTVMEGLADSLEELACECARGSAMYYDMESYSEGNLAYDKDEAIRYIEYKISEYKASKAGSYADDMRYTVYFLAENGECVMYQDGKPASAATFPVETEEASVAVRIDMDVSGVYRQPFIKVDSISREAAYGNSLS